MKLFNYIDKLGLKLPKAKIIRTKLCFIYKGWLLLGTHTKLKGRSFPKSAEAKINKWKELRNAMQYFA